MFLERQLNDRLTLRSETAIAEHEARGKKALDANWLICPSCCGVAAIPVDLECKSPAHIAPLANITHAKEGPWDHVVSAAETNANVALKISDEVIAERFKYLSFGKQPNLKDEEPDEDASLSGM